jgi:hypothetical protein
VAGRFRVVVVAFLYWSLRRLLELVVLRSRSEREKEIEILLLRHQLRVLERQVARLQLTQADRALLAAFSRVLPRPVWQRSAFVTPATLLRRHLRHVLAAYVAHYNEHRPHRALAQRPPLHTPPPSDEHRADVIDLDRVRRRELLGGLIHEYQLAA